MPTIAGSIAGQWRRGKQKIDEDGGVDYERAMSRLFRQSTRMHDLNQEILARLNESTGRTIQILIYSDGSQIIYADDGYAPERCNVLFGTEKRQMRQAINGAFPI